jgi:dephospho-CoA kinase
MMLVGLTGNYGSGKSTVARMFGELGALIVDTDIIVRDLLLERAVIAEIRHAFGDEVVADGAVNKQWLAEKVFHDASARVRLENILHPLVFQKIMEESARHATIPDGIMIVEATVVFERGYQARFEKIITVYSPEDVSRQRLLEKNVSEEDIARRLESQLPIEIKIRGADFVIDNGKELDSTRDQVRTIYQELLSTGRRHGNN